MSTKAGQLQFDAGIVEGDVQASEGFDGALDSGLDLIALRYIARDGKGSPALLLDQLDGLFELLRSAADDGHARAFAREGPG